MTKLYLYIILIYHHVCSLKIVVIYVLTNIKNNRFKRNWSCKKQIHKYIGYPFPVIELQSWTKLVETHWNFENKIRVPFSTDLNAHNFYSKPPLPQFNVDIIRQPHVRSIGIISTTLNWGVWGGGQIELYKHYEYDIWSLMCLNNFVQDCGYATQPETPPVATSLLIICNHLLQKICKS